MLIADPIDALNLSYGRMHLFFPVYPLKQKMNPGCPGTPMGGFLVSIRSKKFSGMPGTGFVGNEQPGAHNYGSFTS
jgi:hypothetical protein